MWPDVLFAKPPPRHWALYLSSFHTYTLKSADQEQSYIICWGSRISYFGMAFSRHMGVESGRQIARKMRRSSPSGHKHRGSWGYPIATVTQHRSAIPETYAQMGPFMQISDSLTDLNISYHWPGDSLARSGDWPLCVIPCWSQVRWLDTLSDMPPYPFYLWSKDCLKGRRKIDPALISQRVSHTPTNPKASAARLQRPIKQAIKDICDQKKKLSTYSEILNEGSMLWSLKVLLWVYHV